MIPSILTKVIPLELYMYSIRHFSQLLVFLATPFVLVACGGGSGGSVSTSEVEQNQALTKDTAFVYVERNISSLEQSMAKAKLNKTNQNASLLELGSPYDFNPGAKLVSRSSLDTSAIDTELLSQYFGSSDFDVKDVNISADGKKAIFAAHGPYNHPRDYTWNIYEYSFSTKSIRRVIESDWTANAGEDTNPTYALDGTIIFSSNRAAGNPDSPVDNIVDADQAPYCHKVDAGDNVSLLHSMTPEGRNILQLTYGKNHDIKPTTLKDGRIAFVRWSHTEEIVEGCPVEVSAQLDSESSGMPTGLDSPAKWSQDKLCSLAALTDKGYVLPTNHYTLLTITPDGKDLDQLYKEVTVAGSDEGFIEVDQIIQVENGQLVALLKHHYNSMVGGDIVELQSPKQTQSEQVFGNIAPESLVGNVALYPNQHSVDGWYSAFWPYRDGSGRLLVSWSQCATTNGSLNELCQSSAEGGAVEGRYGIWVLDQKSGSRLPIVSARKNVVYSNIAVAQPQVGLNFPFEPYRANYVDNLDSNHIACEYPSSSSSSYSSYSSYSSSSSSSYSSSSASSYIYVPTSSSSVMSSVPSSSSVMSSVPSSSSVMSSVPSSSSVMSSIPSSSSVMSSSSSSSVMSSSSSSSVMSSSSSSSVMSSSSSSSVMSSSSSSSSVNNKPVADAGPDKTVEIGDVVLLDGRNSNDVDGDALNYSWSIVSAPAESMAGFNGTASDEMSQIEVDKEGEYVIQLIVNDGILYSEADMVTVTVEKPAPVCKMDGITERTIPVTIRDFKDSHPDFEYVIANDLGIVKETLGADGLPVYANNQGKTTTGKVNFDQWYRDVEGVNMNFSQSLKMTRAADSTIWTYVNTNFFPIDGMGFGNYKNYGHNFHFTMESHLEFDYVGGEVFSFQGDDDLWIFINGKLAIDIGGVHDVIAKSVNLDEVAAQLGIEKGKTYSFDLFFAERHTIKSNFMFQTNINLECK